MGEKKRTAYKMSKEVAVGIDLGTTYSCVGAWKNNQVEIIANDQGTRTTPSYVAFTDSERLIGNAAKNQVSMNPLNTVFDAKRLIGRDYDDPDVQKDMKHWPFTVKKGPSGKPMIQVQYKGESKEFGAEEISAMVLKNENRRRSIPWHRCSVRCYHRTCILQRLPTSSNQR